MNATTTSSLQADPVQPVRVEVDGVALPGDCLIPPEASGLVLLAHVGVSGRRSARNRHVTRRLRAAGFGTVGFDLLPEEEEGDNGMDLRFDIPLLTRRLLAATGYATREADERSLRFGYFGSSTGAAAVLRLAAGGAADPAAVVSRGGRPDLAGDALGRVRAPTLLLVGARDEAVLDLTLGAFEELRCARRLEVVPGATHLFEEPGCADVVADRAVEWFQQHMAPPLSGLHP